jgi:amino acid efflux transporter
MDEMRATLSPLRGAAVMLNIVLGAGLLTLPGLAVQHAGENALTVWLACAVASIPLLAAFAVISRSHPDQGGLAKIAGLAFGRYGYAATTFLFLGAVLFGLPSIALTGGYYASAMLGGSPHVFAVGMLLFAVAINLVSVEWTSRINAIIASVVLVALAGIALVGVTLVSPSWEPLRPPLPPTISLQVFGQVFMMIFFAFTGWELAANLSADFHNPRRDVPIAIGLSFCVAVLLYVVLAVIAGSLGLSDKAAAPFVVLFETRFGWMGGTFIAGVAVILVIANLAAAVWAVSRMVWASAGEGLLPRNLRSLKNGTPYRAVITTVSALVAVEVISAVGAFDLGVMLGVAGQNFLLIYGISALALGVSSPKRAEKILALTCITEVLLLVAFRAGEGLAYPIFLCVIAIAVVRQGHRPAILGTLD